jgi:hypothetical protein
VLTKAELEILPVEGHVKEDVEKRKVWHSEIFWSLYIFLWSEKFFLVFSFIETSFLLKTDIFEVLISQCLVFVKCNIIWLF